MNKLTTVLWFDGDAEEAVDFYCSVFKKAKKGHVSRYTGAGREVHGQPAGRVMTVEFELAGVSFTALNGGPQFKFNESVSLMVHCKDQKEVDFYWGKLTADGGKESMCGWLKDRYGLSWQITPDVLLELMRGPKAGKVMEAFMKMRKLDIAALKKAAA